MPTGTNSLPDSSYYHNSTPPFWNIFSQWPSIGYPNSINAGTNPAKKRYEGGDYFASANASLSNITLSDGSLTPAFNSTIIQYSASVANNVSSISLAPTASELNVTIRVNGVAVASGSPTLPISLVEGDNAITVLVTALDGTTIKTYTITVARASLPTHITFSGKVLLQGAFNIVSNSMDNVLNTAGILQVNAAGQPYNNLSGTESFASNFFSLNQQIVDWVLIELRNASNPSTIVARRAAFVKRDGTLVDIDGVSMLISFPAQSPGIII